MFNINLHVSMSFMLIDRPYEYPTYAYSLVDVEGNTYAL